MKYLRQDSAYKGVAFTKLGVESCLHSTEELIAVYDIGAEVLNWLQSMSGDSASYS